MSIRARLAESPSVADLRVLAETIAVTVATWVLLGWLFDRAITQSDGSVFGVPYTQSALRAGFDWTHHLYRFGVLGGASMHDYAGTLPIVQVCGLLGLSTTATVNAITMFVQTCFGFFGIKAIAALIATWSGAPATLSPPQRIIAIWACGFAPVIGWRLAVGHEALLLGLLPMVATLSLLWAARAGTLSNAALVIATIAVFHGVSGLGEQTLIYSAIFGAPLAIATLLGPWGRPQWSVVLAIAAGALIALPRVVGMIHFAASGDAGRSLADSVTYSYGAGSWRDWLASIPWTRAFAAGSDAHERNFAIGPLVAFVAIAWPRGVSRRLVWGVVAGAVLAIVFADDIAPLSTALLELPTLGAFRVPARAILPMLMVVPLLALACAWATPGGSGRVPWLGIAIAALVIAVARGVSPVIREPLAWIACIGLAATIRWRPISHATFDALLGVTLALGVIAFDERFPRDVAVDTVEHGPKQLHDAVLAQAPELAMALHRVEIVDPPLPFAMSMAFAAQLSSLDGDFNPPRRFLELLSALSGQPVPPTTVVFRLARSGEFPVLQQMYDVDYLIGNASIEALPATPGPAWFPTHVVVIDDAADMTRALGRDVHTALATTAWLLRRDPARAPATCDGARVTNVATDELGQTATISVEVAADCALIVATNYVGSLHSTAIVGGATRDVAVFPIDIALTGIAVPAGATTIVLAPKAYLPWWSRVGSILGVALLLVAIARRRATDP